MVFWNFMKMVILVEIRKAKKGDLPSILEMQKLAFKSEAKLLSDNLVLKLTQTIDGITEDFNNGKILKAVVDGKIVGSVHTRYSENILHMSCFAVSPLLKNLGIGRKLILAAEELYPDARYLLSTSSISEKNLPLYVKNGYKEFKREHLEENVDIVFLEKTTEDRKQNKYELMQMAKKNAKMSLLLGTLPGSFILISFFLLVRLGRLPVITALWAWLAYGVFFAAPILSIRGIMLSFQAHKDGYDGWIRWAGLICSIISLLGILPFTLYFLPIFLPFILFFIPLVVIFLLLRH